ncbi:class I SAM-dependent DNA methyltransferase [Micromonospora sp. MA102]|uniref:type I restriction-modification system subunit M n=1 Tax=Micromonospora sp. MA102 TaxID=2952755 RepID=UPI0021C6F171|nr:class I SAM-dependent DNA methyltransferase [Micromonospora sp. MA102]
MSRRGDDLVNLIWSLADLLRGDYRQPEYGRVILPFTLLRRLDCVLEPTKEAVLARHKQLKDMGLRNVDPVLRKTAGLSFYNTSEMSFRKLHGDQDQVALNLRAYIEGFSPGAVDVLDKYGFDSQISRLAGAGLLYQIVAKFAEVDLDLESVPNDQMGYLFEELVQRFSENSNETAGEHFTPREVVKLMVNLLLAPDEEDLVIPGLVRKVYDPACGTGGMLTEAQEHIQAYNPHATVEVYGQELNGETYAICRSEMMLKGGEPTKIAFGNSLSQDGHEGERFDYMLANPPFGVEWKKIEKFIKDEAARGHAGRFGAGLPRINDGSLLFLQHMISKMKRPEEGGSRLAIVFNGPPLFTGGAGSGESEIRRWILENDLLEGIVALPDQLFYNTGISTYFWILTNRKEPARRRRVVLLDGRDYWTKVRKSLGDKRKMLTDEHIAELTRAYVEALSIADDPEHPQHAKVKIFKTTDFGYQRITVERPLRLRFEVSEETVAILTKESAVADYPDRESLLASAKSLIGRHARSRSRFARQIAKLGTLPAEIETAVWNAFTVRDPQGEAQKDRAGNLMPDRGLRVEKSIPLEEEPDVYFAREVLPKSSDSWLDKARTRIGYVVSPSAFAPRSWEPHLGPLEEVAEMVIAQRVERQAELGLPILRAAALYSTHDASELTDQPRGGEFLSHCRGGDVVGDVTGWRRLPIEFGEALTPMKVIRAGAGASVLCEWLNSPTFRQLNQLARIEPATLVPVALIADPDFEHAINDLGERRQSISRVTARLRPNIFQQSVGGSDTARRVARLAVSEVRLIDALVRPLEDPLWRAERSYPHHIAALARQYRIASSARRLECLKKLGEGIARTLGIVSLAILISREGKVSSRQLSAFQAGASFAKWLNTTQDLAIAGPIPELRNLEDFLDPGGVNDSLRLICSHRNDEAHAHAVPSLGQIEDDVAMLEPALVSSLEAVSWLSRVDWFYVGECHYLGEGASGFRWIGERLHGSHPDWEPLDKRGNPLKPTRVYFEDPSAAGPLSLWPLVDVAFCEGCKSRELYLFDRSGVSGLTLRTLKNHQKIVMA